MEELLADQTTTPPPSYEKVDLESVMVTPTAPPLYPQLPTDDSPLLFGECVYVGSAWSEGMCVCGGGGHVHTSTSCRL